MRANSTDLDIDTEEIFESPKNIQPAAFWADFPDQRAHYYQYLKADPSCHQVDTFQGEPIYASQDFFFAEKAGEISFLVRWQETQFPGKKGAAVTQIALWRDRVKGQKGLADHVFWNHVYPLKHAVMTDSSQTQHGRQFWRARVADAFARGIPVYLVDKSAWTATLVANAGQFEEAVRVAYGNTDRNRDLLLLITGKEVGTLAVVEARNTFTPTHLS